MTRRYLWTLFAFWSWEAHAEGLNSQIEALIKLENEAKVEYDRLIRYKKALDCLTGENTSQLNLTCFAREKIGIRVFGSCSDDKACKVKVSLGSSDSDNVDIIEDAAEDAEIVALDQCGAFKPPPDNDDCRCRSAIRLNIKRIPQEQARKTNIDKVELYIKRDDDAWQKVFASEDISRDTDSVASVAHVANDKIRANEVFKAAEGGVCN